MTNHDLIEYVASIARRAGDAIMSIYGTSYDVSYKLDASPVTDADRQANAIILQALLSLTPTIPVVSEESISTNIEHHTVNTFWLVDPLDGTKEFINRNGEFTVNIALVDQGISVLGVVYAPAINQLYAGCQDTGAWLEDNGNRRSIHCRIIPSAGLTVLISRSHNDQTRLDQCLERYQVAQCMPMGSSLKLCTIAQGQADLYPRLGRTMEWDTAAGHAVLTAAGGCIATLNGAPLRYGKPDLVNPDFVAKGLSSYSS